jgi:NAD(P) transhydrogenase subunit alpha
MRLAIPVETTPGERRVAIVPKSVAELKKLSLEVVFESGCGRPAWIPDEQYTASGAIAGSTTDAELIATVSGIPASSVASGAVVVGLLDPVRNPARVLQLSERKCTAFALELLPRITRAQEMDVLSSQSTVAGYAAAVLAAGRLPKFFPLLMTAAGTITPATVLVLGAGVAGLQAIATARRLGAVVEAFDVRPAVKEQVESLGATFISVEVAADSQGGYARELAKDEHEKELAALAAHAAKADVIISTALVPKGAAPVLVTREMVGSMKPGSLIIDLAAPAGGNCELTKPGEETVENGVTILGLMNIPSSMPQASSQLYSHNITKFISGMISEGKLAINFEDEIYKATCVMRDGEVLNESLQQAVGAAK